MKLKDIINHVDKSPKFIDEIYIGDFVEQFFYDVLHSTQSYDNQNRLVAYYVVQWYCTGSYVGMRVYFFDDEPVAVSMKTGRKMPEELEWISKEAYKKVFEYLLSLKKEEENEPHIAVCDLEQDLGDTYKIEFYGQLFDYHLKNALLKGKPVTIIDRATKETIPDKYKDKYIECYGKIRHQDSTEEWIDLKKLDFPFNLTK